MKQFLLMIFVTMFATVAAMTEPFWGLLLYYTFAVLRPQYMWRWALPIELRWSLFAALLVMVSASLNLGRIAHKIKPNFVAILTAIFGALVMLSVVTAYDTDIAQKWGIEYGKIILMALIAAVLITEIWHIRILSLMALSMLGYIAWEINSLYLIDGRLDIFHNGYGNLDNNGAGLLMALGTPFAYAFAISSRRMWQRGLSWFAGVLMIHALMMSYSRGAMLAALVGAVWLLIHHRPRLQAGLIAVILCLTISVLAGKEIQERFISTTNFETDYSAQSRIASWEAAWTLAWERPLIGQGIRNSNQFTYYYGADNRGRTIHNQFLQIAADSGIPAMTVYILIMLTTGFYLHRSRQLCQRFLRDVYSERQPRVSDDQIHAIKAIDAIALGCQGSLVVFITGATFLSLEWVEVPWLVTIIGGVLPGVIHKHLADLTQQQEQEQLLGHTQPPTPDTAGPPRHVHPVPPPAIA